MQKSRIGFPYFHILDKGSHVLNISTNPPPVFNLIITGHAPAPARLIGPPPAPESARPLGQPEQQAPASTDNILGVYNATGALNNDKHRRDGGLIAIA